LFHPFGIGFDEVFDGPAGRYVGKSLTRQMLYSATTIAQRFSAAQRTGRSAAMRAHRVSRRYNAMLKFKDINGLRRARRAAAGVSAGPYGT